MLTDYEIPDYNRRAGQCGHLWQCVRNHSVTMNCPHTSGLVPTVPLHICCSHLPYTWTQPRQITHGLSSDKRDDTFLAWQFLFLSSSVIYPDYCVSMIPRPPQQMSEDLQKLYGRHHGLIYKFSICFIMHYNVNLTFCNYLLNYPKFVHISLCN